MRASTVRLSLRAIPNRGTNSPTTRTNATKMSPSSKGKTLITFDVDGTLIRASGQDANKFHKDAFMHGFREVYGVETYPVGIDVIQHHGSTDQLISAAVMRHHGVEESVVVERMRAHCDAMSAYAVERKDTAADGLELLVGVVSLLQKLAARDDVVVCLVTGNLQPIAWAKMERLGVAEYFTPPRFGGFGSDHTDRGELVALAAARAQSHGIDVDPHRRYHFGDTPADISAAEAAGAIPVGLLTGIFSRQQLIDASSTDDLIVFDDLSDTDRVMRAVGLL